MADKRLSLALIETPAPTVNALAIVRKLSPGGPSRREDETRFIDQ